MTYSASIEVQSFFAETCYLLLYFFEWNFAMSSLFPLLHLCFSSCMFIDGNGGNHEVDPDGFGKLKADKLCKNLIEWNIYWS